MLTADTLYNLKDVRDISDFVYLGDPYPDNVDEYSLRPDDNLREIQNKFPIIDRDVFVKRLEMLIDIFDKNGYMFDGYDSRQRRGRPIGSLLFKKQHKSGYHEIGLFSFIRYNEKEFIDMLRRIDKR